MQSGWTDLAGFGGSLSLWFRSRGLPFGHGGGAVRSIWLGAWVVLLAIATAQPIGAESPRRTARLIVKFAGSGEHALTDCAARLHRERRAFSAATADRSDSLDRLNRRFAVRQIEPLLRGADGSLAEHRRRFRERVAAKRARHEGALRSRRLPRSAATETVELPDLAHVYTLELGAESSLTEALALYAADPHVEYVQPDHVRELDSLPNDPFLVSSGSWGQAFADLWGLHRIRAPEAWDLSRGDGIVVAVVDTGLDYHHPDIADNVWINAGEDLDQNGRADAADLNGLDDDGNGFVDDLRGFDFGDSLDLDGDGDYDDPGDLSDADPFDEAGHGTHVAGTIAAVADNGIGIAGVAPNARIMAVKGFPDAGTSSLDSTLWRAVLYAADNGARVINNSWSCSPACPRNPLAEDVVAIVHAMGVVIVTSASNRQADVAFLSPENMREVITVASSGQDDQPSRTFSNFGWLVDLAAPGGDPFEPPGVRSARRNILSLRSSADLDSEPFAVAGDYLRNAGTSMSAPHVSGVVALLLARDPQLDYEAVRSVLRRSASDLGPPGHDVEMGSGRLDALSALTYGQPSDVELAITAPRPTSRFSSGTATIRVEGRAVGRDLVSWTLEYGVGSRPTEWHVIRDSTNERVTNGGLAEWRVDGLEQGAYVLRLRALDTDGLTIVEFTQISLEWNEPEPISRPGAVALRPDVSGDRVVWHSMRDSEGTEGSERNIDLVLADLSRSGHRDSDLDPDAERVIVTGAGDQHSPALSGRTLAWLDERAGRVHPEVRACRVRGEPDSCEEIEIAPGRAVTRPPAVTAGRVFWIDSSTGASDLHGCGLDPHAARCDETPLGLPNLIRGFVEGDGSSLAWIEPQAGQAIASCRIDRRTGRCTDLRSVGFTLSLSSPAVSGDLFAWVAFEIRGRAPLHVCAVDLQTGECPVVVVATSVDDPRPRLSGDRLVWDSRIGDQNGDVFYCEFDRLRERCPVQRLTADMARQGESAIDGDRVVWEDDRDGETRIYGTRLPRIGRLHDRRVRAGHRLVVPVRAFGANGDALEWTVEVADAGSLAGELPKIVRSDGRRARVVWRPDADQLGMHVVTVSTTTTSGLVARRSLRVEVIPEPRS